MNKSLHEVGFIRTSKSCTGEELHYRGQYSPLLEEKGKCSFGLFSNVSMQENVHDILLKWIGYG